MKKTPIWLRPDQVDLLRTVLDSSLTYINEKTGRILPDNEERQLLRFCARRVQEIAALLPASEPQIEVVARKAQP
jgi:hypothetical protein